MSLTEEWKHRVERWQDALWNACYRPLDSIQLSGYVTLGTAHRRTSAGWRIQAHANWHTVGRKVGYAWLKGSITLPVEAAGKRIILQIKPGDTVKARYG